MKKLRRFLSILCMILGVVLGIYVGLWLLCIGGIVQIVNAVQMNPMDGFSIDIGILKFICSGEVGVIIAWIGFIIGVMID